VGQKHCLLEKTLWLVGMHSCVEIPMALWLEENRSWGLRVWEQRVEFGKLVVFKEQTTCNKK